jgi:hypothetical protein
MMGIFNQISETVDPFQAYLLYMFEEKLSPNVSGSTSFDDKVLPCDEIQKAVFILIEWISFRQTRCVQGLVFMQHQHFLFNSEKKARQQVNISQALEVNIVLQRYQKVKERQLW